MRRKISFRQYSLSNPSQRSSHFNVRNCVRKIKEHLRGKITQDEKTTRRPACCPWRRPGNQLAKNHHQGGPAWEDRGRSAGRGWWSPACRCTCTSPCHPSSAVAAADRPGLLADWTAVGCVADELARERITFRRRRPVVGQDRQRRLLMEIRRGFPERFPRGQSSGTGGHARPRAAE